MLVSLNLFSYGYAARDDSYWTTLFHRAYPDFATGPYRLSSQCQVRHVGITIVWSTLLRIVNNRACLYKICLYYNWSKVYCVQQLESIFQELRIDCSSQLLLGPKKTPFLVSNYICYLRRPLSSCYIYYLQRPLSSARPHLEIWSLAS